MLKQNPFLMVYCFFDTFSSSLEIEGNVRAVKFHSNRTVDKEDMDVRTSRHLDIPTMDRQTDEQAYSC